MGGPSTHLLRCRGECLPHSKARAAILALGESTPLAHHAPCGAPGIRRSGAVSERNRATAPPSSTGCGRYLRKTPGLPVLPSDLQPRCSSQLTRKPSRIEHP